MILLTGIAQVVEKSHIGDDVFDDQQHEAKPWEKLSPAGFPIPYPTRRWQKFHGLQRTLHLKQPLPYSAWDHEQEWLKANKYRWASSLKIPCI